MSHVMYRLFEGVGWNQDFTGFFVFRDHGHGTVSGKAPNDSIPSVCHPGN